MLAIMIYEIGYYVQSVLLEWSHIVCSCSRQLPSTIGSCCCYNFTSTLQMWTVLVNIIFKEICCYDLVVYLLECDSRRSCKRSGNIQNIVLYAVIS